MSKSLYTKYRPQQFKHVIGQETTKKILQNSIKKNKINHAYLLYGIRGTGKTTLARIFSKSINCFNLTDQYEPCDQCESCKQISSSSSLDVIEIDAASNNGVDEIRQLTEKANYLTTSSKYKVYIIDEVHMLSKAAFNALLKTLEEPPKNTIFLLATTEINKIPETIISRTLMLNLEQLNTENIIEGLKYILEQENIEFNIEALRYISKISGGSLRDAISSLEVVLLSSNRVEINEVLNILGLINYDEIKEKLLNDSYSLIEEIDNNKKDPKKTLYMLIEVVTDLIKEELVEFKPLLTKLLDVLISLKDPFLIKIALKSILVNMTKYDVSRETNNTKEIIKNDEELISIKQEKVSLEEPTPDDNSGLNTTKESETSNLEEDELFSTSEIDLLNAKTEEIRFADELIKRESLKGKLELQKDKIDEYNQPNSNKEKELESESLIDSDDFDSKEQDKEETNVINNQNNKEDNENNKGIEENTSHEEVEEKSTEEDIFVKEDDIEEVNADNSINLDKEKELESENMIDQENLEEKEQDKEEIDIIDNQINSESDKIDKELEENNLESERLVEEEHTVDQKDNNIEDKEEKQSITDFINAKNYVSVLFNWDQIILDSIKDRWKYIDQYQSNNAWKKYVSILNESEVLASSKSEIIIGFGDEINYENFKKISLENDLIDFVKELTGKNLFLLPIMPEQWKKIVSLHKNLTDKGERIDLKLEIPSLSNVDNEEENLKKIFGEKLKFK